MTAAILIAAAALLDSIAHGGWKDRVAFVLLIAGFHAGWADTDTARNLATWIDGALVSIVTFFGVDIPAKEQPILFAAMVTMLVLLGVAMLLRDTPKEGAEGLAGHLHARVSCSSPRASRLNPRIWVMGALLGLLASYADFPLLASVMATGFMETAGDFLAGLGAAK